MGSGGSLGGVFFGGMRVCVHMCNWGFFKSVLLCFIGVFALFTILYLRVWF